MRTELVHGSLVLALVLIVPTALAAPRASVAIEACDATLTAELERLIAVELAALAQSDSDSGSDAQLRIRCGPHFADLALLEGGGLPPVTRRVDVSRVEARAQARVLAISAAELLRANPPAKPPAAPPLRAVEVPPRPAQAPPGSFAVGLGPSVLTFATGAGPFLGGTLLSRVDLAPRAALEASASVAGAEQDLPGGRASLLLGHAFAGGAWRAVRRSPDVSVFAGLRLGWVRGRGQADDPDLTVSRTMSLPWGGPVLGADVRSWSSLFGAGLRAEAGYALLSAYGRVDRSRVVELEGAFVALTVFLGLGS